MPRKIIILFVTLFATAAAIGAGFESSLAARRCSTSDSAVCAADPNCHWDYERRGCYEGAAPHQDPCASHTDQGICDADRTLNCKWKSGTKTCEQAG